jgi:hypothetical protein
VKSSAENRSLIESVLADDRVSEEGLADSLAAYARFPRVNLATANIDPEAVKLLPQEMARRYFCIPIRIEGRNVLVAMANPTDYRAMQEIEFTVDDFGKAKLFIEALGYQKFFYYEKYRTVFDLDGCHIMLDELPYGNFVEIEGNAIDSIQAVANKLSLQWERAIPTGYHLLFEEMCKRHPDLDSTDLSFSALKGLNITAKDLSVHAADE